MIESCTVVILENQDCTISKDDSPLLVVAKNNPLQDGGRLNDTNILPEALANKDIELQEVINLHRGTKLVYYIITITNRERELLVHSCTTHY